MFILVVDMFLPFVEKVEIWVKAGEDFFFLCFSSCNSVFMIVAVFLAGIFMF